jgi:hypothetical protein
MANEPDNLVLQHLRAMRAEIAESHKQIRTEMNLLRDELKAVEARVRCPEQKVGVSDL